MIAVTAAIQLAAVVPAKDVLAAAVAAKHTKPEKTAHASPAVLAKAKINSFKFICDDTLINTRVIYAANI